MANSVLSHPRFHDEAKAFEWVEARLWPRGPVCPFCEPADKPAKIGRLNGKTTRHGLYKCYGCRKPFTVRKGSIFEESHLPLHLWLQAIHLLCSSKKGIATKQMQRLLKCSMTTAWFLTHRIRECMTPREPGQLGGEGLTVEADETALTNSRKTKRGPGRKKPHGVVLALVERGGNLRSMSVDHRMVGPLVRKHVHEASRLVTDSAQHYKFTGVAKHESVDHSKFEWARGDVSVNSLEGWFSVLKRGLIGTYQCVDKRHLDRYLSEFSFRQNTRAKLGINDERRADLCLEGAKGKRLTYAATDRA